MQIATNKYKPADGYVGHVVAAVKIFDVAEESATNMKETAMSKFRKKPVVIEAIECSEVKRNIHNEPTSLPRWIIDAYHELALVMLPDGIAIKTLEGDMLASADDWIIRGVNGELYPCKPDIFNKTYEAVESREWD